ncbi:MAG TPA: hypothetical protein VNX68_04090 [Nitrosopumilaceae archaeon]|jgi:hypothetical protein|nr:hypothetical protein [Nitrosopumilaceae archaeon]
MTQMDQILQRIDKVLKDNRFIEILYIILTSILFLCGIAAFVCAIIAAQYAWTLPSVVTTFFLKYPLKEIKDLRKKNIALGTAPILINELSKGKAAEEIQKLLQRLYEEER